MNNSIKTVLFILCFVPISTSACPMPSEFDIEDYIQEWTDELSINSQHVSHSFVQ